MNTDWQEKVRARAHAIWERLGRPEGTGERHWAQAEEELRAEGAGAASPGDEAPPGTPGTGEDLCPVATAPAGWTAELAPTAAAAARWSSGSAARDPPAQAALNLLLQDRMQICMGGRAYQALPPQPA